MSERRIGSRLAFGGFLAIVCAAMFIVPSSYAIQRDHSRWLALAIGALAFPLVPGIWHLVAELRRRRTKREAPAKPPLKPAKPGLTGWQRLGLRFALVAVVALGGTYAIARGQTWSALRHHALWFTDWSDPDPIADSELLQRVPASAEAIVWIRAGHTKAFLPMALSGEVEMVIAYSKDDAMVALVGTEEVLDQMEPLVKLDKDGDRLARIDGPSGMRILATPGWRDQKRDPPESLMALLHEAPADANAIAAARPVTIGQPLVRSFVAWARVGDAHVDFTAEVEAVDAASADLLAVAIPRLAKQLPDSKDCGNRAFADVTDTGLVRDGIRIKGTAKLPLEAARGIPRCMAAHGFGR